MTIKVRKIEYVSPKDTIASIIKNNEGITVREILKMVDVCKSTVYKYLSLLEKEGVVKRDIRWSGSRYTFIG
nr:MAG: winged HTH domain protein [Lokiarchaeota virus Ratatoskr Meg22_1012]